MSPIVQLQHHGDIAVIVVDNPPVNTITAAARAGMREALEAVAADAGVRAVILRCAGNNFFTGADINEFSGPPKEAEYRELWGRFEDLKVPMVAAMHGSSIGGGLEIALACHYRIATPTAKFMLPEVTLGIIPGAGGTQRLPRLVGLDNALRMIFDAKPVDAARARDMGLIDEIIDGEFTSGALQYVVKLVAQSAGPRPTSARDVDARALTPEFTARWQAEARRLYPNRTAALTAIEAVQATTRLPFDEGLLFEDKLANQTKATVEAKASIHVFFAERESRKVEGLPADVAPRPITSAGVVGAGTMGGGIAIAFANAGIPVTVLDVTPEALAHGLKVVDSTFESMVKRGRIDAAEKARRMQLINGTVNYRDLASSDVLIEAVFESMDLKKRVFGELDAVAKPGSLLATNTSTLDIDEIAASVKRPQDVIGLHFFSPANVMPLLEVVRAGQTSETAIRTAMELARSIRKTPVLARVCYGFIGNRMMEGYAREALLLTLEGETPRRVDTVLEQFGMAMGILAVFDMAGIDVGVNVHRTNAHRYPPDSTYYQADAALHAVGRLGQKTGKGFYRYEKGDRTRHDDPLKPATSWLVARPSCPSRNGRIPTRKSSSAASTRCSTRGSAFSKKASRSAPAISTWCGARVMDSHVTVAGRCSTRIRLGFRALLAGMQKFRDRFGPMHWEPAPLLVQLVREGRTLADWDRSRRGVTS